MCRERVAAAVSLLQLPASSISHQSPATTPSEPQEPRQAPTTSLSSHASTHDRCVVLTRFELASSPGDTDYAEERRSELEVLESIFPDELTGEARGWWSWGGVEEAWSEERATGAGGYRQAQKMALWLE